jgi:CRP/FNR family transcriptional regulator
MSAHVTHAPRTDRTATRQGTPLHDEGTALSCRSCALNRICLPALLPAEELRILEHSVERGRRLPRGATLVHAGRRLQALYVLRSGSVKHHSLSADGDELVRGFYLPGELIGLEAYAERRYPCEVTALEPSRYCRISAPRFELLMDMLPGLRREILRLLSHSLEESQLLRARIGLASAPARLAGFLLELSRRRERRGFAPHEFDLSMSRRDIAHYLGLTVETVSRALSAFRRTGWLAVRQRHISILNVQAFASLAG